MGDFLGSYDSNNVDFVFGTRATGFADGSMIEFSRDDPKRFKKKVGAKGEVTRSKNNNNAGPIKVKLKNLSPTNRDWYLLSKTGVILPATVTEKGGGGTFGGGAKVWIEEEPSPTLEAEEGVSEWLFGVADIKYGQVPIPII